MKPAREKPARAVFSRLGEMICSSCTLATCMRSALYGKANRGVGEGDQAVAIVESVGGGERIAIANGVIQPHGAEVFADGLFGIVVRERGAAGVAVRLLFRAVGLRPKRRKMAAYGGVQVGHRHISPRRSMGEKSPWRTCGSGTTLTLLRVSACRNPS